jgi:hypothetical protein
MYFKVEGRCDPIHVWTRTYVLTIYIPLILKEWVNFLFFSRAKHIMGHFEDFFMGAERDLDP